MMQVIEKKCHYLMTYDKEISVSQLESTTSMLEKKISEQCDDLIELWSLEVQNNLKILKDKVESIHKIQRNANRNKKISLAIIITTLVFTYLYFTYFRSDSLVWDFIN